MNPKQKVKLATPELSPEIQREVDELQRVFIHTQKHLEKLDEGDNELLDEGDDELLEKSVRTSLDIRKVGNIFMKTKGHDYHTHHFALKMYSQSIAFAPQGTEELVLGYGNRSALLMHVQHYKEALVDIDTALQLSKDDKYKTKLQVRKERCLKLLNEQNLLKSTNT